MLINPLGAKIHLQIVGETLMTRLWSIGEPIYEKKIYKKIGEFILYNFKIKFIFYKWITFKIQLKSKITHSNFMLIPPPVPVTHPRL